MTDREAVPVDLMTREGRGPVWGIASADLNATLLVWPAGHEVPEHTNLERDVLLVVVEGDGSAVVDGHIHPLPPGHALLVERGASRTISAGASGIRYLSVHRRRGPLQIESLR
jgi:quercetin dioxygenase-like cupin family protein